MNTERKTNKSKFQKIHKKRIQIAKFVPSNMAEQANISISTVSLRNLNSTENTSESVQDGGMTNCPNPTVLFVWES